MLAIFRKTNKFCTDDAAGIQIANRMDGEIRGLNQAVRNAADAQALLMTAEGIR